jgi:hypothetical protein
MAIQLLNELLFGLTIEMKIIYKIITNRSRHNKHNKILKTQKPLRM